MIIIDVFFVKKILIFLLKGKYQVWKEEEYFRDNHSGGKSIHQRKGSKSQTCEHCLAHSRISWGEPIIITVPDQWTIWDEAQEEKILNDVVYLSFSR